MTPLYRSYLQIDSGEKQIVYPNYKSDLTLDYELETNQKFYRAKLSGKINFVRDDYNLINNAPFDSTFYLYIEKSDDWGQTYNQYYKAKFMKTDCTINDDDMIISVQPETLDEYNDVLAGLENEYNLVELAPEIEFLTIRKRPLIQIYVPGDSIVSCFLGGTNWEQDANVVDDQNALINTYYFSLCNILKEINITGDGTPNDIVALYTGKMNNKAQQKEFQGKLYSTENYMYYIYISQQQASGTPWGNVLVEIRRIADDVALFRYTRRKAFGEPFDTLEFDMAAVGGSGATGTLHADMKSYNIYARYLCDVEKINDVNTYPLPTDDIVENNRNYRRAIGYAVDVAYISNIFQMSQQNMDWPTTASTLRLHLPYMDKYITQ